MRQMVKDISSILIITIVVLSLVYGFTTKANAIGYTLPYVIQIKDDYSGTDRVFISDGKFYAVNSTDVVGITPLECNYCIEIVYNEAQQNWQTLEVFNLSKENQKAWKDFGGDYIIGSSASTYKSSNYVILVGVGNTTQYLQWRNQIHITTNSEWSSKTQAKFGSYNGDISSLPHGLTQDQIKEIINTELNSHTELTTQATLITQNITNMYNSYTAGYITYETAVNEITNNIYNLNELSQNNTGTVADLLVINNGLTYGQTVNDTLLQDREEAFWETRDIGDETSSNAQQSDQEEIDYLDSLIAETTHEISDLSPSENFTAEQIATTTEIIEGVWENPIIKKIIPVAACFMVICVALGIRYRL